MKYTMEEFKEMFDEAKKTIVEEDIKENNEKINDPMAGFMVSMITMSTLSKMEDKLFKKEEK